jgi:hypothetical protein
MAELKWARRRRGVLSGSIRVRCMHFVAKLDLLAWSRHGHGLSCFRFLCFGIECLVFNIRFRENVSCADCFKQSIGGLRRSRKDNSYEHPHCRILPLREDAEVWYLEACCVPCAEDGEAQDGSTHRCNMYELLLFA